MPTNLVEPYLKFDDDYAVDYSVDEVRYVKVNTAIGTNLNSAGDITFSHSDVSSYDRLSKSFIQIRGKIESNTDVAYTAANVAAFINNGPMFLFRSAQLLFGTTTIETVRELGVSTLVTALITNHEKDYLKSFVPDTTANATSSGHVDRKAYINASGIGNFEMIIPLSHIFGFCRTYDKIITGCEKRLILTRESDKNSILRLAAAPEGKVSVKEISWHVPQIIPSLESKATILRKIQNGLTYEIPFQSYRVARYDVPVAPTFNVTIPKTGSSERITAAIIVFQTDLNNDDTKNNGVFNHMDVDTIRMTLGSQDFPSVTFRTEFGTGRYSQMYNQFRDFVEFFVGTNKEKGFVDYMNFKSLYPIYAFDLSKQVEKHDDRITNLSISCEFRANPAANTVCYVIMISDKMIKYTVDGTRLAFI